MVTQQLVIELLKQPSAETYGALLRAVTLEPDFNLDDNHLKQLWKLFETGDFAAVSDGLTGAMRLWVHSPETHVLACAVAKRQGNLQLAEFEGQFARCCYFGMKATGDGSFEHPYLVARVPDEYALLRHLSRLGDQPKPWTRQSCRPRGRLVVDVFEWPDGTSVHFQLPDADLLTGRMR